MIINHCRQEVLNSQQRNSARAHNHSPRQTSVEKERKCIDMSEGRTVVPDEENEFHEKSRICFFVFRFLDVFKSQIFKNMFSRQENNLIQEQK